MKRTKFKRSVYLLSVIPVFILLTGCSSLWLPSDETAAQLVNDYYLFYHSGEKVKASVIERGEFIKECECYPIKFKIIFSNQRNNNKTFYFYKKKSGEVALKNSFR
jgi:hypothetical protein